MAKIDDINTLLSQIDSATTEIASDLKRLRDQLVDNPTPEQLEAVRAKLDAHAQRLTVLGQDPVNPVPPTV